jgi:hypothetical protein
LASSGKGPSTGESGGDHNIDCCQHQQHWNGRKAPSAGESGCGLSFVWPQAAA